MRERAEKRVVAQYGAQQIERARSFFVNVPIHQLFGEAIAVENYRAAAIFPILAQIDEEILEEREPRFVPPMCVFAPKILRIGRKALVEPNLGPVFARYQVAPPL